MAHQAPTTQSLRPAGSDLPALLAWLRRLRQRRSIASTIIPLALLWVGLSIASPHFFTVENISNILLQSSPLVLIAGGMTFALIAAEIDLSVGSVVALTGSMVALLTVGDHVLWPFAVVIAMVTGVAVGLVNSWFTTHLGMPSFVATLAMLGIARGGALLLTNGQSIYGLPPGFDFIGQGKIGPVPFPVVIAGVVLTGMHALLTRTRLGLNIYGVGGNAEAARLAGVDVRHTKVIVLVLSAVMASLAGLIVAARLDAGSGTVGEDLLLDSIAAVVIGGTSLLGGVGRISGTVLGVVLIASIRNGLVLLNVSAFWQQVAIGSIILLAVSLDHLAKERS